MSIIESQEKTLERLAREFGDDFINFAKIDKIKLYGADGDILEFFKNKLLSYLEEKGRKTEIGFGRNGAYNIDVGFFLRLGYFEGFNEEE